MIQMSDFISKQQKLAIVSDQVGISWTGQAGFAFKDSSGLIYHVDPYLSNVCSQHIGYHRAVPAPVEAKDVVADFILVTHEHHDHLDDWSLPVIAETNPKAVFAGPPACISSFLKLDFSPERLITIQRGETKQIGNAIVKAILAYHTNDSVGYVLKFGNLTFYMTGDTTYSDDLIENVDENPDFLAACMNGRLGCLSIPDAARLSGHIQPSYAVPMHYGMFMENTADPKEFVRQAEAYSGITKGFIMEYGEWYLFSKEHGFVLNR
jgi:L-ascorbate 6-phosphate lactonase